MGVEILLFVELFMKVRQLKEHKKITGAWDRNNVSMLLVDFVIQLLTITFFVLNHTVKAESGEITEQFVGKLVNMQWDSADLGFMDKKSEFLDTFNDLDAKIRTAEAIDIFGMMTAVVIFLRMVWATSAHPRIAQISSTLGFAFSDMMHFFAVFLLVLWGFAIIGWWRFGRTRQDFQDITTAMLTQFDAILGPPGALPLSAGDGAGEDFEYLFFALLTHLVNFFFLINFFLAIVVDAYSKVMAQVERSIVDQNALQDFVAMVNMYVVRLRHNWPSEDQVMNSLKGSSKQFISPDDLYPECGFPSLRSARAYYNYYMRYNFLHEPQVEVSMSDLQRINTETQTMMRHVLARLDEDSSSKQKLITKQAPMSLASVAPPMLNEPTIVAEI